MEGENEMYNFAKVWFTVFLSLCYCYLMGKITQKGGTRLLICVLPVVCLFLALPLKLNSIHLGGLTAFFVAWLANFKLLLFAFGKGPLCADPSVSLGRFVALACFPIKIIQQNPPPKSQYNKNPLLNSHKNGQINENPSRFEFHLNGKSNTDPSPDSYLNGQINENPSFKSHKNCKSNANPSSDSYLNGQNNENPSLKSHINGKSNANPSPNSYQNGQIKEHPLPQMPQKDPKSLLNYATKGLLLAMLIQVYDYSDYIHPKLILFLYCFHIYFCLELILAMVAGLARTLLGLELEPQFDEPYLSTSLQDFWGRRWNLMVTSILRPTVYEPVRNLSSGAIGRRWAALPAVMATFVASAIMHELIFYYLGRVRPTWEITWFFLLHGTCLIAEIALKKLFALKLRSPTLVSRALTVAFVMTTGFWLFFPQLLRCKADVRAFGEYAAVGVFVKDVGVAFADLLIPIRGLAIAKSV